MLKCACDETKPYIFVSYSHMDSDEVHKIITKLYKDGYNIWFDEGIDPGTEWDEYIASHVKNAGYFFAFISHNYLESSNCKDELNFARDLDKERLIVYLEEVELPVGIQMRVNRLQAIHKYSYASDSDFLKKIFSANNIRSFQIKDRIKDIYKKNIQNREFVLKSRTVLIPQKYLIEKKYFDDIELTEYLFYKPEILKFLKQNGPDGLYCSGFSLKLWFKNEADLPDIPHIICFMVQICDKSLDNLNIVFEESPITFPMKKENGLLTVSFQFVCDFCNEQENETDFVFETMKKNELILNARFIVTNTFVDESFTLEGDIIADECEHNANELLKSSVSYDESEYY